MNLICSASWEIWDGYVHYPTAGTESPAESQAFYVNSPYGLSLIHNGNFIEC